MKIDLNLKSNENNPEQVKSENYKEWIDILLVLLQAVRIDEKESSISLQKYKAVFTVQEEMIIKNKIFELIGRM